MRKNIIYTDKYRFLEALLKSYNKKIYNLVITSSDLGDQEIIPDNYLYPFFFIIRGIKNISFYERCFINT